MHLAWEAAVKITKQCDSGRGINKMVSAFPCTFISVEYFLFRELEKLPSQSANRNFFSCLSKKSLLMCLLILSNAGDARK